VKKAITIAICIPLLIAFILWSRNSLNAARRPAREIRALSLAYDLIQTTNSTKLLGGGPEFRADLAEILGWPAWRDIDRSPLGDPWAVVRLIITNDHGQALQMRLRDEFPSDRFRLLSYRRITGPSGAANRSQPVRAVTNQTSAAAGSGR
jgi:hypothetical protein